MQDIVVKIVKLGYIGHASSTLKLKTVEKDCRITILLNSPSLTPCSSGNLSEFRVFLFCF